MSSSHIREALDKFKKTIKDLDLDKRIAAAKWLEGVIVSQCLTAGERESLVKAANQYIGDVEEGEYTEAVNKIIEYLMHIQRSTNRALRKRSKQSIRPNPVPL